jgi:hypothetical protein
MAIVCPNATTLSPFPDGIAYGTPPTTGASLGMAEAGYASPLPSKSPPPDAASAVLFVYGARETGIGAPVEVGAE